MLRFHGISAATLALSLVFTLNSQAQCDDLPGKAAKGVAPSAHEAHRALARALGFIQKDAVKWREEHQCASCHHGALTVWVQNEARSRGYDVPTETLGENVEWAKGTFMPMVDRPYDPRPGWRMVGLGPIYLALGSQLAPRVEGLSSDEMKRIAAHVVSRQQDDGAYEEPPPQNGPPPVFESREVMALWCYLALEPYATKQKEEEDPLHAQACREKITAFLGANKSSDTTQAQALRLLVAARNGESRESLQPRVDRLFSLQQSDGGWAQVPDAPSDAYATGQVLYMLSLTGTGQGRPEVERAVAFLVKTQREDGSWPMKSRARPGATPYKNPVPITYFGSAWGTLGLLRTLPRPQAATPREAIKSARASLRAASASRCETRSASLRLRAPRSPSARRTRATRTWSHH